MIGDHYVVNRDMHDELQVSCNSVPLTDLQLILAGDFFSTLSIT